MAVSIRRRLYLGTLYNTLLNAKMTNIVALGPEESR